MKNLILIVVLFASACVSDVQAQGWPVRHFITDDGGIYIKPTELSDEDYKQVENFLGGSDPGGFRTEQICDLAEKHIPKKWLGLADFVSTITFGLCSDSEDHIGEALKTQLYPMMKTMCEGMTGISEHTLIARSCEFKALRFLNCTFKEPEIEPTCAGLRELCMSTKASGYVYPPANGKPGLGGGYFKIPGCTCVATYIKDDPRNNCVMPSGASVSQAYLP